MRKKIREYGFATCASCGLRSVIVGKGKDWVVAGGRYYCFKPVCQEAARKALTVVVQIERPGT